MRFRRLEFVGGTSAKFWEISRDGAEVTVRFGRLGTNGQSQTKDLGSETDAAFQVARLVREKLAKGYVEVAAEDTASALGPMDFKTGITRPPALPPYEVPPLPGDGPASIGDVRLPAGRRLSGNPSMTPPGIEMVSAPVMWLTDTPVADSGGLLYRLRGPSAQMGLVPVLVMGLDDDGARPWDSQEFSPTDPRRTDHFDPAQVLADMWRESLNEEDEELSLIHI